MKQKRFYEAGKVWTFPYHIDIWKLSYDIQNIRFNKKIYI